MKKKIDFDDLILDDLLPELVTNVKEDMKNFEDLINLDSALKREIFLFDIVEGTGVSIYEQINFWNRYDDKHNIPIEERQPIKIYINSGGGYLSETFTIIDAIKTSRTPVWTINIGLALSGGFFSFITGHKRIATPRSSFLFHEGSTSNAGTSGQFENYTTYYKKQLQILKDLVLDNTKIIEEEYEKIHKDDIWYTADEALEKGICDKIMEDLI